MKHKKLHNQHTKIRESGIRGFCDKGNRSVSPHALSVSRTTMKGKVNTKVQKSIKSKPGYSPDQNLFTSSMGDKNNVTFDYLQSKSINRPELSRTANKNELEVKTYSESPNFSKNTHGAISNLGIYQNKTFYTVNQPKRAGTSLTSYQDEAKRKRVIKKFRNKINVPNTSNSATGALYSKNNRLDEFSNSVQHKSSIKGNEKIFLPINEVLNQARKDQNSDNQVLNDLIKNLSSTRKNKPSLLENINSAIERGLIDLNKSRGQDLLLTGKSLTKDEINEIKKNINLINIQKSVLGSAAGDKRESRPGNNMNNDLFNTSASK